MPQKVLVINYMRCLSSLLLNDVISKFLCFKCKWMNFYDILGIISCSDLFIDKVIIHDSVIKSDLDSVIRAHSGLPPLWNFE